MRHRRHRLRIFLFRRNVMFRSQIIQVFVFLYTPWFAKSVTSWWDRVHFWIYLWTKSHEVAKLDQLINISKGNNFREFFEQFGGLGLSSRSYLVANYVKIPVAHFCEKVNKRQLKIAKNNYCKNGQILLYCHFNKVIKGPGTSFQSPVLKNMFRNVFHTCIWSNLILIVFRIQKK